MALPTNVGQGWVVGKFIDSAGNSAEGTITFAPSPSKMLDNTADVPVTILPQPVTVTLVSGAFQQQLIATNDVDLNPTGWTYMVSFKLKVNNVAVTIPPFPIAVPEGLLASAVDLTRDAPVVASGGAFITRGFGVPDPATGSPGQVVTLGSDGATLEFDTPLSNVASTDITDATAVGRALMTAASAAAARTTLALVAVATSGAYSDLTGRPTIPTIPSDIGAQPVDADLTSIAALTTTTYGRALLTLAAQADLMALIAAATISASGLVELATTAESQTGTDTVRASTPAGTKAAIDQRIDNTTGLTSGSTTNAPSVAATKAYADALLDANNAYQYKGVIDCSANPNYPAASAGHTYKVSVAGKIGGASGVNVEVGDTATCLVDATAAGTQAAVGANWIVVQTNIDGAVVGPASSVAADFATFSGTTGKVVQDSGLALDTSGTLSSNSDTKIPSQKAVKTYADAVAAAGLTATGTATLTNKRITPRVVAMTDGATITPAGDTMDLGTVTLGGNRTMAAPSGTPTDNQLLAFRITQDGTGSRTLTWDAIYSFSAGAPLLKTAAAGVDYLRFRWSAGSSKWIAITTDLASDAEASAGLDTSRAVTPHGVAAAISGKLDSSALVAGVLAGFSGILQMVVYSAGWAANANYTNAAYSWLFLGGDDAHVPPTVAGGVLWVEA